MPRSTTSTQPSRAGRGPGKVRKLDNAATPGIHSHEAFALHSHDIRASLTVIMGAAATLQKHGARLTESQWRHFLGAIVGRAERIEAFTSDMLEVGRSEERGVELGIQPTDLGQLVTSVVDRWMSQRPTQRISVSSSGFGHRGMRADPVRLVRVIDRLLANAVSRSSSCGEIRVVLRSGVEGVTLTVEDDGPRLVAGTAARQFDKFASMEGRSHEIGLGLYVSRLIVEAHGGRIWASSPRATTFGFALPVNAKDGCR